MNIEQRLRILESQNPARGLTKDGQNYLTKMIALSGCNQTIEQLDKGQNLHPFELILMAYSGGEQPEGVITEVPRPEAITGN